MCHDRPQCISHALMEMIPFSARPSINTFLQHSNTISLTTWSRPRYLDFGNVRELFVFLWFLFRGSQNGAIWIRCRFHIWLFMCFYIGRFNAKLSTMCTLSVREGLTTAILNVRKLRKIFVKERSRLYWR